MLSRSYLETMSLNISEEISKKSFKGVGKLLFAVIRERNRLREKQLSKKELRLDNLRNSQPIQIAQDGKIRRFTVRKVCSKKKSKDVAGQPLARVLDRSKYQSIQSLRRIYESL